MTITAWYQWRLRGTLPYSGGWLEQPLSVLANFQALDNVYAAYTSGKEGGYDFTKTTPLQNDLIRWIENDGD